jgi:hypothetical protein
MISATTAERDATPGSDEWREGGGMSQLTVRIRATLVPT